MKSILLILLLLVVFVEQSQAFSIPVSYGIKRASFTKLYESPIDDEVALQEELNAMAEGSGGGGSGGSGGRCHGVAARPLRGANQAPFRRWLPRSALASSSASGMSGCVLLR